MNKQTIMDDLNSKWNKVVEKGYTPIYLALQGSQNYGLDRNDSEYNSDIDAKCFVIPNLNDIILGKEYVSRTLLLDDNSQIDIKDIRYLKNICEKTNTSYLELFFTDYFLPSMDEMNPDFKKIYDMRYELENINPSKLISAILGMASEKKNALCHRYPIKAEIIDKYGYDPKQLSHLKRLEVMMFDIYQKGNAFHQALRIPEKNDREIIEKYKFEIMPCDEAVKISEEIIEKMRTFKHQWVENNAKSKLNQDTLDKVSELMLQCVLNYTKKEIKEEEIR